MKDSSPEPCGFQPSRMRYQRKLTCWEVTDNNTSLRRSENGPRSPSPSLPVHQRVAPVTRCCRYYSARPEFFPPTWRRHASIDTGYEANQCHTAFSRLISCFRRIGHIYPLIITTACTVRPSIEAWGYQRNRRPGPKSVGMY
jgi:hypothetical protein